MRLLAVLFLSLTLTAEPRKFNDTIRDVYLDGKLDRTAQTLVSADAPRVYAVVCGDEVLLFDPAAKTVSKAARSEFEFAKDRTSATTSAMPAQTGNSTMTAPAPAGTFVQPDGATFLATVEGRSIYVGSHQSPAGPMTIEELWRTAPVWQAIAEQYEPDGAVVERLRQVQTPTRLQIVLATWCGDSRQHVPRLLKSIEQAANPNLIVELIGVGPDFETPMETIQSLSITNVPTVRVLREESEIGRYVETPANGTVEADIADILHGTQQPHPGRLELGAVLSSGTYILRDPKRRANGTESYTIYERPRGGAIVKSVIARGTSKTETWASFDKDRKPLSAEVTHRTSDGVTRTRYSRRENLLYATSRGATGGIVQQVLAVPDDFALVTPATVTYAWAAGKRAYVAGEGGAGALRDADWSVNGTTVKFADGTTRRTR
ncbi:MAG TPA: thioredoxin family protein [Thermoanaerobaculia bacterium]|jgi:hypothetical protein